MKEFIAKKNDSGQRLDKYLKKILPNASTGFIYKMLRKKNFTLNGMKAAGTEIVNEKDVIKLFLSDETFEKFSVSKDELQNEYNMLKSLDLSGLEIVYEDKDILGASKPCGMLSQKASANDISANERLIGYLIRNNSLDIETYCRFKPSVCNRLDRNTSGLILMGKSLFGLQSLSSALKERTVQKFYLAWVNGIIKEPMQVDAYLSKDEATNKVSISEKKLDETYKEIHTAYEPLIQVMDDVNSRTLLKVHLITGKSHQIRAHLAYIGHPIIGDIKYGNKVANDYFKKNYGVKSQLLHAHYVIFSDGKEITANPARIFDDISV